MMARSTVANGANTSPLYQWLTAEAPGLLGSKAISGTSPSSWSANQRPGDPPLRTAGRAEEAGGDIEAALAG